VANVIVVGADVAGMASAARLQGAGHQVTVIESGTTYGGSHQTVERDGFRVATADTTLTLPAAFADLFAKTGKPLEDVVALKQSDVGYHIRFAGGAEFELPPAGVGAWAESLRTTFGDDAGSQWRGLMSHAATTWSGVRPSHTNERRSAKLSFLKRQESLRQLTTRFELSASLRQIVEWFAIRDGLDPRKTSHHVSVQPYLEQTFGNHTVDGGIRTLVDALYKRCESLGVEFEFSSPPTRIVTGDGRVRGVEISNSQYLTCDWLVQRGANSSHRPFTLIIAVAGALELPTTSVWFPRDSDTELTSVFDRNQRTVDPTMCIRIHNEQVPADCTALTIEVPSANEVPLTEAAWYAEHLVRLLAQRGVDLHRRVLWTHIVESATYATVPETRAKGIVTSNTSIIPGGGLSLDALAGEGVLLKIGRA
jgi:glycine/D-amino acid oxidase-like deaminating enzyme